MSLGEEGAMEDAWLTWAKRLQSIALTGLHFSSDRYDRQRYEEIGRIANEMLGYLGSVPIGRIERLMTRLNFLNQTLNLLNLQSLHQQLSKLRPLPRLLVFEIHEHILAA